MHKGYRTRRDLHSTPRQANFGWGTIYIHEVLDFVLHLGGDRREFPCVHVLSLALICANFQSTRQRGGLHSWQHSFPDIHRSKRIETRER
jgi:hypothetical protein